MSKYATRGATKLRNKDNHLLVLAWLDSNHLLTPSVSRLSLAFAITTTVLQFKLPRNKRGRIELHGSEDGMTGY